MILLGETDPNGREIPFHLSEEDPTIPITGHAFSTGELQLKLPGAGYVNANVANVVEKGFGDYALRLTAGQVVTEGWAYLYANVASGADPNAQPWSSAEQIGTQAQGIFVGETADLKREVMFHLPDSTNPLTPVTLHAFLTGEVKICVPGGTYVNADVTRIVEKGFGDYALKLTGAQVVAKGKLYLYVNVPGAQKWSAWYEIVDQVTGTSGQATLANPSPAAGTELGSTRSIGRHTPVAFNVLTGGVPVDDTTTPWCIWIKYRNDDRGFVVYDSVTGFMPPYHNLSTWTAGAALMALLPDGGWQDAIEQICIGGQSSPAVVPIRYGASGSDKPPNAP